MKFIALVSAAAVAVALASAPAAADTRHHGHGGWKWKTVCKTVSHHGHKTRQCHKVRVRW